MAKNSRYRFYPKYSHTLTPYHIYPKKEQDHLTTTVCVKRCYMRDKQFRLLSDAAIWDYTICPGLSITKTRLFKYTENFTTKNENFQMNNLDSFPIFAHRLWYLLEPPRRGSSNEYLQSMVLSRKIMYTPVNASFTR